MPKPAAAPAAHQTGETTPPRQQDGYAAAVRRIVDQAPKATPAQRDQIKAVLRPARSS